MKRVKPWVFPVLFLLCMWIALETGTLYWQLSVKHPSPVAVGVDCGATFLAIMYAIIYTWLGLYRD